jgi:hypothetical protein
MTTQTTEHQWMQMVTTPVLMIETEDGVFPVPDPSGKEGVRYGCFTCNMGLEEALEVNCPGFDIFDPEGLK